jgi:5-methylthioribose kinase
MIRRVVGIAHTEDLDGIEDIEQRLRGMPSIVHTLSLTVCA